jgi:hypothetical protein
MYWPYRHRQQHMRLRQWFQFPALIISKLDGSGKVICAANVATLVAAAPLGLPTNVSKVWLLLPA